MSELDDEYLFEFARAQQAEAQRRHFDQADRCEHCGHNFYGTRCRSHLVSYHGGAPCLCPTSLEEQP